MPKKITHEEFIEKIKVKNPNIEILEEYVNAHTKIECRCKVCSHKWKVCPNNLLNKKGCPECAKNNKSITKRKKMNDFINEIKNVNPNIEILGNYITNHTKIKCKCKIDGYIWYPYPSSLLRGHGCPRCANILLSKNKTKTHKSFLLELSKINSEINILTQYSGADKNIKCKCLKCGCVWEATPHNLLKGKGCPKCKQSKGENKIETILNKYNINYKPQYKFKNCKLHRELPFDFYIPDLNITIEYDGRQHYEIIDYFGGLDGFIDTKIRDTIKTIYCKENNIKLIRIPYWDFDKIEKILEKELKVK